MLQHQGRSTSGIITTLIAKTWHLVSSKKCYVLQVVVHNLPWNTTWQQLKDAFVDTGNIERADVIIDSSGRSRYLFFLPKHFKQ